jgi:hypothetical protein
MILLYLAISVFLCKLVQSQTFVRNYVGDPEAEMTTPQILKYWGYPVESMIKVVFT